MILKVTKVLRDPDQGNQPVLAKVNDQPMLHVKLRKGATCAICSTELAKGGEAWRPALDSAHRGVERYIRVCGACIEACP